MGCGNYHTSYRVVFTSFSSEITKSIYNLFDDSPQVSQYMVSALKGLNSNDTACGVSTEFDGMFGIPAFKSVLFSAKFSFPVLSGYTPSITMLDYSTAPSSGPNKFPKYVKLGSFVTIQLIGFPEGSTVYIQIIGQHKCADYMHMDPTHSRRGMKEGTPDTTRCTSCFV